MQVDVLRRWHVLPLVPELFMWQPGRTVAASLMSTNVRDTNPGCPCAELHTPAPSGYAAWYDWAASMYYRGARQSNCPGCGLFLIWSAPREPRLNRPSRR